MCRVSSVTQELHQSHSIRNQDQWLDFWQPYKLKKHLTEINWRRGSTFWRWHPWVSAHRAVTVQHRFLVKPFYKNLNESHGQSWYIKQWIISSMNDFTQKRSLVALTLHFCPDISPTKPLSYIIPAWSWMSLWSAPLVPVVPALFEQDHWAGRKNWTPQLAFPPLQSKNAHRPKVNLTSRLCCPSWIKKM